MDWPGIQVAIADLERRRLGLPTRLEEAAKRAEMERANAVATSGLETAAVNRDLTQAQIDSIPERERRAAELDAARIRNYDETPLPRTEPTSDFKRILDMTDPAAQAQAIKIYNQMYPRAEGSSQPRTGWQPQYDAASGRLMGYYHPATETFRAVGEGSLPAGTRPGAIPFGEMEKRALLTSMLSDAQRLGTLVGSADKPTPVGQSIGYYSGRVNDIRRSGVLAPLGVEPPPDAVNEMFRIADNMADMLLRARSGAQINEQEYQRLRRLMPDPRTDAATFRSNLAEFVRETNNIMTARQGMPLPQSGATDPGLSPEPTADPFEGRTATGPNGQKVVRKGGRWVAQ